MSKTQKFAAVKADTLIFIKHGAMIKKRSSRHSFEKLESFPSKEKHLRAKSNLALADDICDQLYQNKIGREDINLLITKMGSQLWSNQISELRIKTGAEDIETVLVLWIWHQLMLVGQFITLCLLLTRCFH